MSVNVADCDDIMNMLEQIKGGNRSADKDKKADEKAFEDAA